jgi:hypothetical protein
MTQIDKDYNYASFTLPYDFLSLLYTLRRLTKYRSSIPTHESLLRKYMAEYI